MVVLCQQEKRPHPAKGNRMRAREEIRCGEGLLIPSTFGANYRFVVPTRTPLSLIIHSDITQETNTLSRLQKDYSSHPQGIAVTTPKVSATG